VAEDLLCTRRSAFDELKLKSVAGYTKCAGQDDDGSGICLEALDRLVKAQPGQSFAAGKAVRAKLNHAAALPYFATALPNPACETSPAAPHATAAEPKWKPLDARTIQIEGAAKAYKGPQGELVVMAKVRNEDADRARFVE